MRRVFVALLAVMLVSQSSATSDCPDARTCREAALEAAARQDYETFHDLAWRAIQKGEPDDPALMYLLARAQSLSGRPGDALVMLSRLAERGIATDAATSDDFRRVRALPGWKAFAALDAAVRARSSAPTVDSRAVETPAAVTAAAKRVNEEEPLRFDTMPFAAAGLAYDGVSRRFIAGDRDARKLVVIDEPSRHVANLAAAHSAGFGEIAALEIDRHEGDLWVASVETGSSTLHKLQLVSGRVIYAVAAPADAGRVEFVDVAVAARGTILALDRAGRRLFSLARNSRALRIAATLGGGNPLSVAPADGHAAYVSDEAGVTRVDLASRASIPVKRSGDVDISGLTRIRMYRGALVGMQKTRDGARAVRVKLNETGTRAVSLDVLDPDVPPSGEATASVAGGVLYYLSGAAVRRIKLQ